MKRNIGLFNSNHKSRRRDEYETVPLPARRVLEIKIETLKSLLIPGVTPEASHPELEQKIADAERKLRELDADPFTDPQPPTEAEKQAEEIKDTAALIASMYGDLNVSEHRRCDANGENAQVYMNRRISFCSEVVNSPKLPPGRKVIVTAEFAKRWTDNPEHYKERFNAQDVEIKP